MNSKQKLAGLVGTLGLCMVLWFPMWNVDLVNSPIIESPFFNTNTVKPVLLGSITILGDDETVNFRRCLFLPRVPVVCALSRVPRDEDRDPPRPASRERSIAETEPVHKLRLSTKITLDYPHMFLEILAILTPTFFFMYLLGSQPLAKTIAKDAQPNPL
jgi:hypothetical protein